jgi:hypothetical protein
MPILDTRGLKCVALVEPSELARINVPDSTPRVTIRLRTLDGREVMADLNTKSLRKGIAAVAQYGTDGCVCMVHGKLVRTATVDELAEAGLSVQPRTVARAA